MKVTFSLLKLLILLVDVAEYLKSQTNFHMLNSIENLRSLMFVGGTYTPEFAGVMFLFLFVFKCLATYCFYFHFFFIEWGKKNFNRSYEAMKCDEFWKKVTLPVEERFKATGGSSYSGGYFLIRGWRPHVVWWAQAQLLTFFWILFASQLFQNLI
jgi:hypothetical protein